MCTFTLYICGATVDSYMLDISVLYSVGSGQGSPLTSGSWSGVEPNGPGLVRSWSRAYYKEGGNHMPTDTAWRVEKKCSSCPFMPAGEGKHLWDSLADGRREEILEGLSTAGHFLCHKTTTETGDGTNLVCAGSMEWQKKNGHQESIYVRVCRAIGRPPE